MRGTGHRFAGGHMRLAGPARHRSACHAAHGVGVLLRVYANCIDSRPGMPTSVSATP